MTEPSPPLPTVSPTPPTSPTMPVRRPRALSTALAVAVLGLALGALAAMLTLIDGVLVRPLPYGDPGRLVMVEGSFKDQGETQPFPVSQMDFADWRRRTAVFSHMSVFGSLGFNLEQGERSRRLSGELVNADYLDLLGLRPALGRFFVAAEDDKPFTRYVVVLGHDLWRSDFAADPAVVGRLLRLNGHEYTVVGVAPRGFRGLTDQADLWVPSMLPPIPDYLNVRRERWAGGVARLAPGVTLRQAQAQLDGATAALAREIPNMDHGIGATLTPLAESWFGALRRPLLRLGVAAGVLLLLALWDAALLLAPAAGTWRERRRRLLSTAFGAAVLGLLLAAWATPWLVDASGVQIQSFVPRLPGVGVTLAVVGAALAGGWLAAWLGGAAGGWRRTRRLVAGVQVLLAVALAVAAAREARSYQRTMNGDLGFRRDGLLTFRMDLKGQKFMSNPLVTDLLRRQYLPRIAAVDGVQQAAMSNPTIPSDGMVGGYMTVEDHASKAPDGTYITMWHSVSPGYFETLGIPLVAGRGFTAADVTAPVVVVSKAFADQQWPGKDPLGKRIKQDARGVASEPWMTVIGVAAEAHHEGIQSDGSPAPDIYMPLFQFPLRLPLTINFLVRPRPGVVAASLLPALHREMMAIAPELPDYDAATMAERLAKQTADARFQVILLCLFAGLGVVLAAAALQGLRRVT